MLGCVAGDLALATVTVMAGAAAATVLVVREWRREPSGPATGNEEDQRG